MTACDHMDWLKASINEKAKATNGGKPAAVIPSLDVGEQCGAKTDGRCSAQTAEYGDLPGSVAKWEKKKDPVEQGPQRISRGVRHPKMLRGNNEFPGI